MKIAIDCCDLDHNKIDGTRVYIKNVLDRLGALTSNDQFLLYHQKDFDPLLVPKVHSTYVDKKIPYKFCWTQTRLAFELNKDKPDVLWMPIQQIPLIVSKEIKTVVTIHDLAWKYFPENYKQLNRLKLDFFAQTAIKRADKLIAVSESTKKDILKFFPKTDEQKISVVHHGFDRQQFEKSFSQEEIGRVLKKYKIVDEKLKISNFILYVGGLDEKENLGVLIDAFDEIKKADNQVNLKLVLVGNDNENSKNTKERIMKSLHSKDVYVTGRVDFDELVVLYQNASILVLPSKYEGFGITVLEGFASKVPVVTTAKSSLVEVGGDAARYFDGESSVALAGALQKILENPTIREGMIQKGLAQAQKFSWEKCAQETLEILKS
jgi:glycosyltransferase involved in cell wall biosynthesis